MQTTKINAIIMAGGKGERLRPLTCKLPKPMVPVMNKPVIEYTIELMQKHNIGKVAITLQYLPSCISDHFGADFNGTPIEYFVEQTPLGTAGSVLSSGDYAKNTLLVMSGDSLCDIDLSEAIAYHKNNNAVATLVLKSVADPREYGVVLTNANGEINRFVEKPDVREIFGNLVNTGIYIIEPEAFEGFEKQQRFDFSKDVFPKLLRENKKIMGYVSQKYWCDIGSIDQYMSAHKDILDGIVEVSLNAKNYDGIWVEQGAMIDNKSVIKAPCYIGADAKILSCVAIEPYSVVGSNCLIQTTANLQRSIVWKNSKIGKNTELRNSVVCDNAKIGNNCTLNEKSVVGSGVVVGQESVVEEGAKVWANKLIERQSVVSNDFVWGNNKDLFALGQISGSLQMFTPEVCARLGKAIAQNIGTNPKIAIAHDATPESNMAMHAILAGIVAASGDVYDCKNALVNVLQNSIIALAVNCGVSISFANEKISIEIFDENAIVYTTAMKKNLATSFAHANATPNSIVGFVATSADTTQFYVANLLRKINVESMKQTPKKIIVADSGTRENELLKLLFGYCGWQVEIASNVEAAKKMHRTQGAVAFAICNNELQIITGGSVICQSALDLFFAYIDLENGEKQIYVDSFAPPNIESVAQNYGATVNRVHSKDLINFADPKSFLFCSKSDPFLTALMLCKWLGDKNIDELAKKMPFLQVETRNVKAKIQDIGKVFALKKSNSAKPVGVNIEGLRVATKNGWVHIVPSQNEIRISATSLSQEYAESIADLYAKKVTRILNDKHVD